MNRKSLEEELENIPFRKDDYIDSLYDELIHHFMKATQDKIGKHYQKAREHMNLDQLSDEIKVKAKAPDDAMYIILQDFYQKSGEDVSNYGSKDELLAYTHTRMKEKNYRKLFSMLKQGWLKESVDFLVDTHVTVFRENVNEIKWEKLRNAEYNDQIAVAAEIVKNNKDFFGQNQNLHEMVQDLKKYVLIEVERINRLRAVKGVIGPDYGKQIRRLNQ